MQRQRVIVVFVGLAAVLTAGLAWRAWFQGARRPLTAADVEPSSPHPRDIYARSGRLWYLGDGFTDPAPPASGSTPPRSATTVSIFNPQKEDVVAVVRAFLENEPPRAEELRVGAGKIVTSSLTTVAGLPPDMAYWLTLEASAPVLPQLRHDDFSPDDPVPDALVAVAPYPGPLKDETTWIYPDGFQGGGDRWYEEEIITILNPGEHPVTVHIRYALRQGEVAEEQIEIPAQRLVVLKPWERASRANNTDGSTVNISGDYAVRIDSSGPVVTQQTRRARWRGRPEVVGSRGMMGAPLRGLGHTLWYYPGGEMHARGTKPGETTWNLLFTYGVDSEPTEMAVTFYPAAMEVASYAPIPVPGQRSDLQWLHQSPWLGKYTGAGSPFALTLLADAPVLPTLASAEYEPDADGCPGAMSVVALYPGPLLNERSWWLGIGDQGTSDQGTTRWLQTYLLFNPSSVAAEVTLTTFDSSGEERRLAPLEVGPESMARIDSSDIEGMPRNRPFAVRADANIPFVAQVTVRAFRPGQPSTRSMYSMMGLPMSLRQP